MTGSDQPDDDGAKLIRRLLAVADEILEADCAAIEEGHTPNQWRHKCEYACRDAAAALVAERALADIAESILRKLVDIGAVQDEGDGSVRVNEGWVYHFEADELAYLAAAWRVARGGQQ